MDVVVRQAVGGAGMPGGVTAAVGSAGFGRMTGDAGTVETGRNRVCHRHFHLTRAPSTVMSASKNRWCEDGQVLVGGVGTSREWIRWALVGLNKKPYVATASCDEPPPGRNGKVSSSSESSHDWRKSRDVGGDSDFLAVWLVLLCKVQTVRARDPRTRRGGEADPWAWALSPTGTTPLEFEPSPAHANPKH